MVISWLGGRFPSPVASCRIAVPLDARRIVTLTDMPITVPCQEPVRVLSFSKAFFASDCALADFGGLSWAKTMAAGARRQIRSVGISVRMSIFIRFSPRLIIGLVCFKQFAELRLQGCGSLGRSKLF